MPEYPECVAAGLRLYDAIEANKQGTDVNGKPFNTLVNLISPFNAARILGR